MYSVYKITNLTNDKCYIGSSMGVEKRWKEHINTAFNKNSKCYGYPLYCAFRKYGIDNFSFDILRDDFDSIEDMRNYEKDMILFFNSCDKGYNQTYETYPTQIATENCQKANQRIRQRCAKVDVYNNIIEEYESYHDAARKNGLDSNCASTIRGVCKGAKHSCNGAVYKDLDAEGKVIDVEYKTRKRRTALYALNVKTLEEFYYESILVASKATGLERKRIHDCISGSPRFSIIHDLIFREIDEYGELVEIPNTPTLEEKLEEFNERNPVINGERHNIREWCEIYNITPASYYKRKRHGMTTIEALTTPKRR